MTYDPSGDQSLSKNERRGAARDKARVLRDSQKKRERRGKVFLQGGLLVAVLGIAAVVAIVVSSGVRPPSPGPLNMLSDGIKIQQGFTAAPTAALAPDSDPVATKSDATNVISIQIYVDYQCTVCGEFEKTNASQIKTWVASGAVTEEVHPIAILDNLSLGKKYSTRAANSAACVANYSPDSFFSFNALLFDNQPRENSEGLTDAKLVSLAKKAQAKKISSIEKCVADQSFKSWVIAATTRATTGPIAGTNVRKIEATPTVIINGKKYEGAIDDAKEFASAISAAAGETYSKATPSAAPTP